MGLKYPKVLGGAVLGGGLKSDQNGIEIRTPDRPYPPPYGVKIRPKWD